MRKYTGTTNKEESIREQMHKKIAREAAANSVVLLANEKSLPLNKGQKIALFGSGARHTIKGGTGSGDVNARKNVSICEGLVNAGFQITTTDWLDAYDVTYQNAREAWKQYLLDEGERMGYGLGGAYFELPAFAPPAGAPITEKDIKNADTDTAIYVISRTAGEGKDRKLVEGDYYLLPEEKEHIKLISKAFERSVLIVNTGGVVDLSILKEVSIDAVLYIAQPGMEGGNGVADVLSGAVMPSGKLTSTWAADYYDYPNAANYSHMNNNIYNERYEEGIFVGYRYFDSFQKTPIYPFGFGMTYTTFKLENTHVACVNDQVRVTVKVTNTGATYSGREVVQVYVACPQTRFDKEAKRLVAFKKTKELAPSESETVVLSFSLDQLTTYDASIASYILEAGEYLILAGNSSTSLEVAGILVQPEDAVTCECINICELHTSVREFRLSDEQKKVLEEERKNYIKDKKILRIMLPKDAIPFKKIEYGKEEVFDEKVEKIVAQLTVEDMADLVCGASSRGQGSVVGVSADSVPGAAGETTKNLHERFGLPSIILADGPAGIRLADHYQVNPENGEPYEVNFMNTVEEGFFLVPERDLHEGAIDYYQYTTAIPVGTMLAQSFDSELLEKVGQLIGEECKEFEITLWLAPGMNIHRNPLCGRNFEYYSEDPLVSGMTAASLTKGVQSVRGIDVTIKHYACNNQEDNRRGSDSIMTERTLREIYLKNFEYAVKNGDPKSIMSSYNLVNGIHTANSHDLCTKVLRDEWGFDGFVMTDWTTTNGYGGASAAKCIAAGNDCIMPGMPTDPAEIKNAYYKLNGQRLDLESLKRSAKRMVRAILASNRR